MSTKEALFLEMIRAHQAMIYKVALLYTDQAEDRQDLMQEITLQLWKSFEQFEQRSSISTWLYRVAMNTAFHYLKSQRRLTQTPLPPALAVVDPDAEGARQEQLQAMLAAIQTLNAMDKGIVLLYLEDKSYQDIAAIMGISVSNVGTRLQRAKQKLKTIVNQ